MDSPERPIIPCYVAAHRLRCSRAALAKRSARGSVPGAFRIGKEWEFDEATFEAWRRAQGDPNAKPASAFDVDPLPYEAERPEGDAA